jgi:hypothetical protein
VDHTARSTTKENLQSAKCTADAVDLRFVEIAGPRPCMKKAMNKEIPFGFQPAEIIEVTGSDAVFGKQRYERTKRRVLKVLVLRQQLLPPGRVSLLFWGGSSVIFSSDISPA